MGSGFPSVTFRSVIKLLPIEADKAYEFKSERILMFAFRNPGALVV